MPRARAHRTAVPESISSSREFSDAQVQITYELPAAGAQSWTPEHWARATFEGAPAPVRSLMVFGFRCILGLRMDRSQPRQVLGWRLEDSTPGTATLSSSSFLIDAYNVATVEDSRIVWTTVVRYRRGIARPIWRLIELVHLILMPYNLDHAARARRIRQLPTTSSACRRGGGTASIPRRRGGTVR